MSTRQPYDPRSQAEPQGRRGGRRSPSRAVRGGDEQGPHRSGLHLGPIAITPVRVFLLVALAGGLGFLAYSVLVRDQLQVPLMATGFAICGIVLGVVAVIAVLGVVRAGRAGRDGTAVVTALVGGLVAVGAMLSLAAAVIFSMIWGATPGS